jgi:hypothetical protein
VHCTELCICLSARAVWLANHAHLLNSLELVLADSNKHDAATNLSPKQHAAAKLAIAAGLQEAAAPACGQAGGLHITSCKIECGQAMSAAILQTLPGSTLTSLHYDICIPDYAEREDITAVLRRVGQVLAGLQQLRQLDLQSCFDRCEDLCIGPSLPGFSALTQLTRLRLSQVGRLGLSGADVHPHKLQALEHTEAHDSTQAAVICTVTACSWYTDAEKQAQHLVAGMCDSTGGCYVCACVCNAAHSCCRGQRMHRNKKLCLYSLAHDVFFSSPHGTAVLEHTSS